MNDIYIDKGLSDTKKAAGVLASVASPLALFSLATAKGKSDGRLSLDIYVKDYRGNASAPRVEKVDDTHKIERLFHKKNTDRQIANGLRTGFMVGSEKLLNQILKRLAKA